MLLSQDDHADTTEPVVAGATGRRRRRWWIAGGVSAALLAAAAGLTISAAAWGQELREGDQLLPGVTIAGVDVGDTTRTEAAALVTAELDRHLDGEVVLAHEVGTWTTSPRQLGATTDLEDVVAEAFTGTTGATLPELIATRWFGSTSQLALDVTITRDEAAAAALVDEVVATIDLDPTDATVAWVDEAAVVEPHTDGRAVEVDELTTALTAALDGADTAEATEVAIPSVVLPVARTTAAAETSAVISEQAVAAALDREVTVTYGDASWTVTPREVGAGYDGASVVLASLEDPTTPPSVALTLASEDLTETVAAIATEIDIAPVSATAAYRSGRVEVSPERDGRSVERGTARDRLVEALTGVDTEVELPVAPARAAVTRASFDTVLVVRQGARQVELHRGGSVARSWPVAVGTGGSPTPTGTFVVGAKRFEPTWVNPARDRWGADMPARIGPGPDNPLGLRALNWNRPGGGDTLIRFHGTPNEDSIGEAASNGCVRMFNEDVIELYDLVPSGTTILSVS